MFNAVSPYKFSRIVTWVPCLLSTDTETQGCVRSCYCHV